MTPPYPFVTCQYHAGEHQAYAACIHLVQEGAVAVLIEEPRPGHMGSALCSACVGQDTLLTVDQLRVVCELCFELHIASRTAQ